MHSGVQEGRNRGMMGRTRRAKRGALEEGKWGWSDCGVERKGGLTAWVSGVQQGLPKEIMYPDREPRSWSGRPPRRTPFPVHPPDQPPTVGCGRGHGIFAITFESVAATPRAWTLTQPQRAAPCGVGLRGSGSRLGSLSIGRCS